MISKKLTSILLASLFLFGCSTNGEDLQGKFGGSGTSSDSRTTCDYGSDTSVANLRECIEDFLVDEYGPVEDENFNLIYERLGDIQDQLDSIESKIDEL